MNCPACNEQACDPREQVTVAAQHARYAPDDRSLQQRLTSAAVESALEYQMVRCRGCGLEFCIPMRAPSPAWYKLAYQALDLYPAARWEFFEVLRRIGANDSIVELGCGSGAFLEECRKRGVTASGVDFSDDAVNVCVAKGLRAHTFDLRRPCGEQDAERANHVVAFHVLEHLDDPAVLFEHAGALGSQSCNLWVSVPADQRPSRRFGQTDFLDQPPHHMTRWNPRAFARIGERLGWRLAEALYEPIELRTAVWSISVSSGVYRNWSAAGRFRNKWIERGFRGVVSPIAVLKRITTERELTGFGMMAHFIRAGADAIR